jgi:carbamoylphosphate synthase large subunit
VQTSEGLASRVYFLPVTHDCVLDIIKKERPDGIIVSMGGQVRVLLFTVTFYANRAHSLTRSP